MSYKYIKLTALFLLLSATTRAQDTLATSITTTMFKYIKSRSKWMTNNI